MNVGVNYMREHMPSSARIHYALIDGGGIAPNVVQARAVVRYLVRSRDLPGLRALFDRVVRVSEGAALMTETAVSHRIFSGDANLIGNGPLEDVMAAEFRHLGPPVFDDADRAFAAEIQATLRPEDVAASFKRAGQRPREGAALGDWLVERDDWSVDDIGSTDVGSVSWAVPTVQAAGTTLRHRHGRAIPGSSPRRASRPPPTRAWCTSPRPWRRRPSR